LYRIFLWHLFPLFVASYLLLKKFFGDLVEVEIVFLKVHPQKTGGKKKTTGRPIRKCNNLPEVTEWQKQLPLYDNKHLA